MKNKQFKQIENTEGDFQAFQMLLGRSTVYDILPSNKLVGLTTLKMKFSKQDIDEITFNPKTFGVDPLHLIFRKDPKFKKYVDHR
ncbi:MAG: hypothetical protein HRU09_15790 [Oligoflexales bacterium]|nr:hypothetical protein [Oligoflexales bacterium]